jgi:hypothetical protein
MNREDIIRMAEEAGAIHYWHLSNLERFAALVASAEREACAEIVDWELDSNGHAEAIKIAIRARGESK